MASIGKYKLAVQASAFPKIIRCTHLRVELVVATPSLSLGFSSQLIGLRDANPLKPLFETRICCDIVAPFFLWQRGLSIERNEPLR